MNLVYISCLSGNKSAGLTYSVPAQIESQSRKDHVFWLNLNPKYTVSEASKVLCRNINDFPSKKISELPHPFNSPDLVIFQGVYFIDYVFISKELIRRKIPYIIIPRGSLTKGAQRIKSLKKRLGNIFFFNKFIKNAVAIQYLNKSEYQTSGDRWNNKALIIPNGITAKNKHKMWGEQSTLKGVFIGRLDVFHKGIDLLIEACANIKHEINGILQIEIYGQDNNRSRDTINELILKHDLQNVLKVHDAIFDQDKKYLLLTSEFFVLTSRFEGHPMGLIEALSYGLPCLVTTGTNMEEEIITGDAGWTAESNAESIGKAIIKLINEKEKLSDKGKNALMVSMNYDWDVLAIRSHQLYADLLEQRWKAAGE